MIFVYVPIWRANPTSTIYRNGKIYASEEKRFVLGSVAVDNGIIVKVFLDGEPCVGEYDEVSDLCGARLDNSSIICDGCKNEIMAHLEDHH